MTPSRQRRTPGAEDAGAPRPPRSYGAGPDNTASGAASVRDGGLFDHEARAVRKAHLERGVIEVPWAAALPTCGHRLEHTPQKRTQ